MPRVASLYLPNLPTDRLRRIEGRDGRPPDPAPLILSHRVGQALAIASACPAARELGLHTGMPLSRARLLVRGLDIRDAAPEADAAVLHRLGLFAARHWTPRAAVSDPSGLWLDLSGVTHLFGGERSMCERILGFCARLGLSARIAVASTAGAAHALARYHVGRIVLCPPGEEASAIAPFPLAALRVDEDVLSAAHRLGIERIGELIVMPRAPLTRRFGKTLLARLDQALGRAGEAFDPIVPQEPPGVTLRLVEPVTTAEAIEQVIGDLLDRLALTLEGLGLAARIFTLSCDRVDGKTQSLTIGTARATRDAHHLLRLLCTKIEKIDPGFGIEAMHLTAGRCEPLGPLPIASELGGDQPSPDLAPLIDRLAGRLSLSSIYREGAFESDVPERSVRRSSPLEEVEEWPRCWPRPVRLLRTPERVEKVMAELPDQPPVRFWWRGRMHVVRTADGPERIYGEWWKRSGEADAVRDYFQIEDQQGVRFWLFRRGDGENARTGDMSWWLQGVFG